MKKIILVLTILFVVSGCIKRSSLFPPSNRGGGTAPVLIELFSNDMCTHCPEAEEIIDSLMSTDTNLYLITYHIGTPDHNDPFYLADSSDINARITYYYGNPYPGTPYLVINGIYSFTGTLGAPAWGEKINELHDRDYSPVLNVSGSFDTSSCSGVIRVTLSYNPVVNYRVRVAMVESNVRYNAPNGDSVYNYLLRKMPGGANGLSGDSTLFNFSIPATVIDSNVDFIIFLQNDDTKEILDVTKISLKNLEQNANTSPIDLETSDTNLVVPPKTLFPTRIYLTNNQSVADSIQLIVVRDSLDSLLWTLSLCGQVCLPNLETVDTVQAGVTDSTYQVEFFHSLSTDPSGIVWIKAWSLTDTTIRDSVRLTVEAEK